MITYGGREVIRHKGILYKVVSRHRSHATAKKRDDKYDPAELIAKDGKWWVRANYLPKDICAKVDRLYPASKIRRIA